MLLRATPGEDGDKETVYMMTTKEKVVAIGGSFLLAGLTITCSLSLNNLINALFNWCFPEPEDRGKRVYYRLVMFLVILSLVVPIACAVINNCRAKQSLIDLDDFALSRRKQL